MHRLFQAQHIQPNMGEKSRAVAHTPAKLPSSTERGQSTSGKQQSILGFFSKAGTNGLSSTRKEGSSPCLKETTKANSLFSVKSRSHTITPVPSSDVIEPSSSQENRGSSTAKVLFSEPNRLSHLLTPSQACR